MDSPIFEPQDDDFDLNPASPALATLTPHNAAPTAYMYPSVSAGAKSTATVSNDSPKKRKRSELDPEIAAEFQRLRTTYPMLDLDATAKHDPASEPLPEISAYHPSFAKAESIAQGVIRRVQETVMSGEDQDEEASYMKELLSAHAAPNYPGVRIICIYGNCGVGKSSLLNAILAIEDASLKTGDGGSGTLVPIEIWRAPDRQQYPFTAVVFYFPLPLCEEIVRNQLANYYDARLAPIEDQCKELVDLGKPALKTFLALFGDKEEFADEGAATRFLARAKSADDPKILTKLLEWTRHIVSELSKLGNCATLPHHTAQDLNKALEPFTQTCEDPVIDGTDLECSVWPFVKKARKYLSNPLLAKKICLVDLPGVSDTNQQRVQLTKSYFRQCHQALIVHGIERAEDDRTLEEYVIDVFRRKRSGSVAVVLSRSDDIEQESNSRTKYSRQQEEQLRSLNDIEDDLGIELKAIRKRMRKSGNSDYVADMKTEELDQFLLKQVRCRRTGILVAARNTKIRKSLQDWYASITNDPQPLPVFCVSSKCYMAHVKGSSAQNPPILTVAMTEIPDVRSYLFSIAGNGGCVNALKHYAVQIRILLNQMDMSCSGLKPMMKRDDLLKVLDGARRGVENAFDGVRQEQNKHSVTPILIKFDTTEDVWIEKAQEYCTRISKYTPAGFTSFLKKGGNWKTPACGKHNWNATLIEPVRADIQPLLDRFHIQGCYIFQTDAVQAVSDMLDKLEQDMKDNLDFAQVNAFKSFFDSLRDRKKQMSTIVEKTTDVMREQITSLNNDCLNDGPSSPFSYKMAQIYKEAIKAEPSKIRRTKHAARSAFFTTAVCARKSGPYAQVRRYLEKGFAKVMDTADRSMVDGCKKVIDGVMHDFNQVCPEREDNGVQALKRREVLGKKVREGKKIVDGELRETLAECGITLD